jgi:hypothetical protein
MSGASGAVDRRDLIFGAFRPGQNVKLSVTRPKRKEEADQSNLTIIWPVDVVDVFGGRHADAYSLD